ncbi:MAG: DUF4276 family protein [Verrucomicrobiales bacterium]|nr:DUF4276 family protein [Verrucomicrobiales bacterium]
MKFVLLVEGNTEKESAAQFLKRWLDPQLKQQVGIQIVRFSGYGELVRKIETKAQMHLDGPQRTEIIGVIGLLDLYGPDFFPSGVTSAKDRVAWGVTHFQNAVNRAQFRMFFAVHEFEAWLLSQTEIFPRDVAAALDKFAQPEQVNFTEPPARLLDRLYKQFRRKNYKKTTDGKLLFAKLDPAIATSKCPYLKVMLDEMLAMAKTAGL